MFHVTLYFCSSFWKISLTLSSNFIVCQDFISDTIFLFSKKFFQFSELPLSYYSISFLFHGCNIFLSLKIFMVFWRFFHVKLTVFVTFLKSFFQMCQFSSDQSLNHVRLFAAPWTAARQASLSITNSRSLLKLMSIESVMPSNHLILCHPLLLPSSIFPRIRVFSSESVLRIRWPKYWSFSFSISPSNEYSGLISFRMDWLDLLAVQRTLKGLLQHHNSKVQMFKNLHLCAYI